MILINLLPPEYRQKRKTPLKYMLVVAGSVAVNASLAAYWGWTAFGVAAEAKSEVAVLQDQSDGLDPQVAHHESLQQESTALQSREEMLRTITSDRVSWTQQVDELVDIIHEGGDGAENYLIWLDDLSVDMKENKRDGSFGVMKANGHSGSDVFAQVANFLEDVENSALSDFFSKPSPPEGVLGQEDPEVIPSFAYNFPLELNLKAPAERTKR
ncbi:MAG: hypothetical protein AB1726_18470 [Planctomycetota bacterium]